MVFITDYFGAMIFVCKDRVVYLIWHTLIKDLNSTDINRSVARTVLILMT